MIRGREQLMSKDNLNALRVLGGRRKKKKEKSAKYNKRITEEDCNKNIKSRAWWKGKIWKIYPMPAIRITCR